MLWLRSQQEDSYLATTGTEFVLHLSHHVQQVIKLLLQTLDPLNIDSAVRLVEGNVHLQGLDQVQLSFPPLLQFVDPEQNIAVVVLEAVDHLLVLLQFVFVQTDSASQSGQILIDLTKDRSGIHHTLTPLSLQGISLWFHQ